MREELAIAYICINARFPLFNVAITYCYQGPSLGFLKPCVFNRTNGQWTRQYKKWISDIQSSLSSRRSKVWPLDVPNLMRYIPGPYPGLKFSNS